MGGNLPRSPKKALAHGAVVGHDVAMPGWATSLVLLAYQSRPSHVAGVGPLYRVHRLPRT